MLSIIRTIGEGSIFHNIWNMSYFLLQGTMILGNICIAHKVCMLQGISDLDMASLIAAFSVSGRDLFHRGGVAQVIM